MPTATPDARPDELMNAPSTRTRTTLRWKDWDDAGALRERLAEIHTHEFVTLNTIRLERAIVATLKRMTGLDSDRLRDSAREDAAMIIAAESDTREMSV